MRTRFESGGTAPEPADIFKRKRGPYKQELQGRLNPHPLPLRGPLIVFQHALGRFNCRDDNYRHGADQPGKKKILEQQQKMVEHEIHDCNCSPARERNQKKAVLLKSELSAQHSHQSMGSVAGLQRPANSCLSQAEFLFSGLDSNGPPTLRATARPWRGRRAV